MKKEYLVVGQAMAPVDVTYTVIAKSGIEAMEKAKNLFESGDHGSVKYADDDAAAIDFKAFHASVI